MRVELSLLLQGLFFFLIYLKLKTVKKTWVPLFRNFRKVLFSTRILWLTYNIGFKKIVKVRGTELFRTSFTLFLHSSQILAGYIHKFRTFFLNILYTEIYTTSLTTTIELFCYLWTSYYLLAAMFMLTVISHQFFNNLKL